MGNKCIKFFAKLALFLY